MAHLTAEAKDVKAGEEEWQVVDGGAAQGGGLEPGSELDLCFICDCTGSMGSYIKAAQTNITTIVDRISNEHGAGVRFGLISYRDHPPQDRTYVTQCFPFTEDQTKMRASVNSMSARGGGDGPEAVTAGLYEALNMPWRPNATKVCVLIADAPPHGLEPHGDGFPNGDPDGRDPLEIAREMVVHNITVYTVGCEPALGQYQFARDFLCTLADITSGQAVALSSAAMLADVIINGSIEELGLAKLQNQIEEEIGKVQQAAREKAVDISEEAAVDEAWSNLQKEGVECLQMQTDGRMVNRTKAFWGSEAEPSKKKSLAEVKASLGVAFPAPAEEEGLAMGGRVLAKKRRPERRSARREERIGCSPMSLTVEECCDDDVDERRSLESDCKGAAPPAAPMPASSNIMKKDLISKDQVARAMNRARCQKRL